MTIRELKALIRNFEDHDELEWLNTKGEWEDLNYESFTEDDFIWALINNTVRHKGER